ncbi:MAG TPA: zinc ribbon domain-containing protein [Longimicrobiaceae bacterium]|jgi:predicted RNA-binding Zn-ribbon protein involved in translation (DUF1610 family)|nr:zinc ribbon domain-containing protein [Longimicrobiaceae bacterium]
MPIHLFSTPVECTHCGAVVEDPTVDKCPNCGALLKERRTPSRLAGVPRRYGQLRFLIGLLRFLGVIVIALAVLVFLFSGDTVPWATRGGVLVGAVLTAAGLWVVAGLIDVALDVEENTRASFREQQLILEALEALGARHEAER